MIVETVKHFYETLKFHRTVNSFAAPKVSRLNFFGFIHVDNHITGAYEYPAEALTSI